MLSMVPVMTATAWQIAKELAIALKYFMEAKAKNTELNNVYESHDREIDIQKEIMDALRKKDEARRNNDNERMDFYTSGVRALQRRVRIQQQISKSLEAKLK